jgi:hypothetical protein
LGASLSIVRAQECRFWCDSVYWEFTWKPFYGGSLDNVGVQRRCFLVLSLDIARAQGTVFGCFPGYCACTGTPFFCVSLDIVRAQ